MASTFALLYGQWVGSLMAYMPEPDMNGFGTQATGTTTTQRILEERVNISNSLFVPTENPTSVTATPIPTRMRGC